MRFLRYDATAKAMIWLKKRDSEEAILEFDSYDGKDDFHQVWTVPNNQFSQWQL